MPTFFIPTHAATKFEYFMLGGMGDLKEHVDDEIADAVNEIVSNICGSIVTSSNAQGFSDLGSAKFEIEGNEIIECSTLSDTPNCYIFEMDMDGESISILIMFDDAILPYLSELRGVESTSNTSEPIQNTPSSDSVVSPVPHVDNSGLSSLLGENGIENLKLLFNIKLRLSVRLGTKVFLLKDILRWDIGEIIELDQMVNEPLDILINGVKIGEGEAVIVEGKFGIKIRTIGTQEDRINQISLGK
ncbi:MAG: FliM/FliN family flagellar motor switch protein [Sphaerochaetaceae bacterium]|nr:FliM/FliN family flagellar motor switch protein [Sphaerochaetaceae bacterium]